MLTKIISWFSLVRKSLYELNHEGSKRSGPEAQPVEDAKSDKAVVQDAIALQKQVISRAEHNVSRKHISKNACKVLYRLQRSGYQAYLVGGCVRDLLLAKEPKDFDIATDARPEQVKKVFNNCRIIGRRFRLAHVFFGREIVEVATFRKTEVQADTKLSAKKPHKVKRFFSKSTLATKQAITVGSDIKKNHVGMLVLDNAYGTIEQDVIRRDFTINALYYNIADFSIVDYVGGIKDIVACQIKIIGNPQERYREDPVRMLRALRFAAKLNFKIETKTATPIKEMAHLLGNIAPARLYEEYTKLFLTGCAHDVFAKLVEYNLFQVMFPQVHAEICSKSVLIKAALQDTDTRFKQDKPVSPGFLLAVFLWEAFCVEYQHAMGQSQVKHYTACPQAISHVISRQIKTVAIPKYISHMIKDIWDLQFRFMLLHIKSVRQILQHPKFRAGYDFILLRARAGDEKVLEVARWWQTFIEGNEKVQKEMLAELSKKSSKWKHKRNNKKKLEPKDE